MESSPLWRTIRAMEREVHYCTTEDGVRIAYCIEGAGPITILSPPAFASGFEEPVRVYEVNWDG